MDFACGYPGSMHDAPVLRHSTIFQRAEHRNILTQPTVNVTGHNIVAYLLGGSAYPLFPWLMKPYPEGTQDPRKWLIARAFIFFPICYVDIAKWMICNNSHSKTALGLNNCFQKL